MKIVFSWDDGRITDEKLFIYHNKYKIPGMFFIANKARNHEMLSSSSIIENESEYICFGGHSYSHISLDSFSKDTIDDEVSKNKDYLEKLLNHKIDHFCLPCGAMNSMVLKSVLSKYKTVRTIKTMCFYSSGPIIRTSFHFYPRGNKSLLLNALRSGSFDAFFDILFHLKRDYYETIKHFISKYENTDKIIHIWGHSYELEELQIWDKLEDLMKFINTHYRQCLYKYEDIYK